MASAVLRSSSSLFCRGSGPNVARSTRLCVRTMAAGSGPSHFILLYAYVPDILEKRDPHREGHLQAIRDALKAEKLVIGGAIADPIDGGLLVFQNSTREEVEAYAKADPYFQGGLVSSYSIRPYMTVKA